MRTIKPGIILLLVLTSFLLVFSPDLPRVLADDESDNTDSFDVSPAGGRWNVTTDNAHTAQVEDSTLHVIDTNNGSGTSGYEMSRDLYRTDSELVTSLKAQGGGNQIEYFRDVLGDPCDFTEDAEGLSNAGNTPVSQENGLGVLAPDGTRNYAYFGLYWNVPFQFHDHVTTCTIRYRFTWTNPQTFRLYLTEEGNTNRYWYSDLYDYSDNSSNVWYEITFVVDVSEGYYSMGGTVHPDIQRYGGLRMAWYTDGVVAAGNYLYLDDIEFNSALSYAGHVENEFEDEWDWEDSSEYFYRSNNISDFNDGTTEDYVADFTTDASTVAVENGWLSIYAYSASTLGVTRGSLSIDASTYTYFALEVRGYSLEGNGFNLDEWGVYDSANDYCYYEDDMNQDIDNATYLLSGELNASWSGTETEINLYFDINDTDEGISGGAYLYLNFTFLYDQELGDYDNWVCRANLDLGYVNPEGYFTYLCMDNTRSAEYMLASGLDVDLDVFTTLNLKVKAQISNRFRLEAYNLDNDYYTNTTSYYFQNTSWHTYSLDIEATFGADSDWDGSNLITVAVVYYDESGNFEADESFSVDYIMLTGNWADTKVTLSFANPSADYDYVNTSLRFWNTSSMRFEVELYDRAGDIAWYYYSSNYTAYINEYVRLELEFDRLQSEFTFKVYYQTSRILNIDFQEGEYTAGSGRTPCFFSPHSNILRFSQINAELAWSEVFIDFIETDFKENEWIQQQAPDDTDWVEDSWQFAHINDTCSAEVSNWSLNVPLLDSISGKAVIESNAPAGVNLHWAALEIGVAVIDHTDGDQHKIFAAELSVMDNGAGSDTAEIYIFSGQAYDVIEYSDACNWDAAFSPTMEFAFNTREDRSKVDLKVSYNLNDTGEAVDAFVITSDLSELSSDASSEFVVWLSYYATQGSGEDTWLIFDEVNVLSRPVFYNWQAAVDATQNGVGGVLGDSGLWDWLAGLFAALFRWLGQIFVGIVTWLGGILSGLVNTVIQPILSVISTALGSIWSELSTWASGILDDIWDAIRAIASDFVGFIGTIIDDAITWLGSVIVDVIDLGALALHTVYDWIFLTLLGQASAFNVYQLLIDIFDLFTTLVNQIENILDIFSILGLIWIFGLPLLSNATIGEYLEGMLEKFSSDITFGISILGFSGRLPFGLLWVIVLVGDLLAGGIFGGFLSW